MSNRMQVIEFEGHGIEYPPTDDMPQLSRNAKNIGNTIMRVCDDREVVLIGTGSSGIATATAIATFQPSMNVMFIRKDGENSHGSKHEVSFRVKELMNSTDRKQLLLVFVDDFVCEGHTMARVMDELYSTYKVNLDIVALLGHYRPDDVGNKVDTKAKLPWLYIKSHVTPWQTGNETIDEMKHKDIEYFDESNRK